MKYGIVMKGGNLRELSGRLLKIVKLIIENETFSFKH